MKGEYLFKYPRLYCIKEVLKIHKKQLNRLYKISNRYTTKLKYDKEYTQVCIKTFLVRLKDNYPNITTFRKLMNQLIHDYNCIPNEIERESFLKNSYGLRNKYFVEYVVKHYK